PRCSRMFCGYVKVCANDGVGLPRQRNIFARESKFEWRQLAAQKLVRVNLHLAASQNGIASQSDVGIDTRLAAGKPAKDLNVLQRPECRDWPCARAVDAQLTVKLATGKKTQVRVDNALRD